MDKRSNTTSDVPLERVRIRIPSIIVDVTCLQVGPASLDVFPYSSSQYWVRSRYMSLAQFFMGFVMIQLRITGEMMLDLCYITVSSPFIHEHLGFQPKSKVEHFRFKNCFIGFYDKNVHFNVDPFTGIQCRFSFGNTCTLRMTKGQRCHSPQIFLYNLNILLKKKKNRTLLSNLFQKK